MMTNDLDASKVVADFIGGQMRTYVFIPHEKIEAHMRAHIDALLFLYQQARRWPLSIKDMGTDYQEYTQRLFDERHKYIKPPREVPPDFIERSFNAIAAAGRNSAAGSFDVVDGFGLGGETATAGLVASALLFAVLEVATETSTDQRAALEGAYATLRKYNLIVGLEKWPDLVSAITRELPGLLQSKP